MTWWIDIESVIMFEFHHVVKGSDNIWCEIKFLFFLSKRRQISSLNHSWTRMSGIGLALKMCQQKHSLWIFRIDLRKSLIKPAWGTLLCENTCHCDLFLVVHHVCLLVNFFYCFCFHSSQYCHFFYRIVFFVVWFGSSVIPPVVLSVMTLFSCCTIEHYFTITICLCWWCLHIVWYSSDPSAVFIQICQFLQ